MTLPIIRGDWAINWSRYFDCYAARSAEEMIYASSPAFLGASVNIDDFSPRHNRDGCRCTQGVLEILPYGNRQDIASEHILCGDLAVYMFPKPTPFVAGGAISAIKQRGWHAEICYKKDKVAYNASVWPEKIRDRRISDLDKNSGPSNTQPVINLYRLVLPSGPVAKSDAFCRSVLAWKAIYDFHRVPPTDNRWYLDRADFSSRESLATIAKALLNRPPGSDPQLEPVTCVQWVYTVFCLALLFPPSERILRDLNIYDAYVKNWHYLNLETLEQDAPFLDDLPFKPYSPAQLLQSFLDTYCEGPDLLFLLRKHGNLTQKVLEQYLQDACPKEYRELIPKYLNQLLQTEDLTIQLPHAPHGFLMPSCFFCEERKARNSQASSWFEYVGTAMHDSILQGIARG